MSEPVLRIEGLTKRFGGLTRRRRSQPRCARRAAACDHRPQRRRQDHAVQPDLRPADARQWPGFFRRTRHHRPEAAPDQPARHQAHAADQERVPEAERRRQSVDHRACRPPLPASVPSGGARPGDRRASRAHARSDRAGGAGRAPGRNAVLRRRRAARDRHGADIGAKTAAARRADLRHEPGRDRAGGGKNPRARADRSTSSSSSTTWRWCSASPTTSP